MIPAARQDVWDWHMRSDAFENLTPWWSPVSVMSRPDAMTEGCRVVLRLWMGPVPVKWVALHQQISPPASFVDFQESGPFAYWNHTHSFHDVDGEGEASTRYHDCVEYAFPGPGFLHPLLNLFFRIQLNALFKFRHQVVKNAFSSHA